MTLTEASTFSEDKIISQGIPSAKSPVSSTALSASNDGFFFLNVKRGVILSSLLIYSLMQENKPVGSSILQLVVTDRDSFHNGPPFSFSILSGNEEEAFALDSDGILRSAVVFRHMESPEYVLCVQVQPCPLPASASFLSCWLLGPLVGFSLSSKST